MPASNTPKLVSCRIFASDSGTPQWLLWDLSETCTVPEGVRASFSASLVPVLPTLPVTAITTASLARARETAPRSFSASSVSATRISRFSPRGALKPGSTMAQEAPWDSAASTKRCPSRFNPRSAMKASSGARLRLSMETPLTGVLGASALLPRTAFTISPIVHSGLGTLCSSLQRGIDRVMIRIRNDGAFDDLSSLVALAGNQQDLSLLEIGDGLGHGGGTAGNFDCPWRRRQDLAANLRRFFAPRIVVGNDGDVCLIHRNRAHLRALALVAIAAAAKHDGEAIVHIGPERIERLGERVRRVGIVDEDWSAGACRRSELQPSPGAAQVCHQRQNLGGVCSGRHAKAGGNERIGRLKGANEWKAEGFRPAGMLHGEALGKTVPLGGQKFQSLALPSHRNDEESSPLGDRDHGRGPGAIHVDAGAGGEPQAVDTPLLKPVARRFERKMGNARLGELGENTVELYRVRRGVSEGLRARWSNNTHSTEACRAEPHLLPELADE